MRCCQSVLSASSSARGRANGHETAARSVFALAPFGTHSTPDFTTVESIAPSPRRGKSIPLYLFQVLMRASGACSAFKIMGR